MTAPLNEKALAEARTSFEMENSLEAAIRAYLAASPSPTMEMEFTHVAKTKLDGLLADGWQVNGYSIQKDDRIGLVTTGAFVGWYSNACEAMNTAEAQVLRLTEENEALRKERTSLIETKREQIDRLTADRDHNAAEYEKVLNSYADENQCLSDKLEAAEARIKALEEALRPFAEYAWSLRGFPESQIELGWLGQNEAGEPAEVNLRVSTFQAARSALKENAL